MDRLPSGSFPKIAGEEVRQLNKLGVNTDLLLIRREIPDKDQEWLNGVNIECLEDRLPSALRVNFKMPSFSFFSSFHLTAPIYGPLALKRKYDLVIAHGTYTCFTAYSLKKIRNMPYAAFVWDPISYILGKVYSDTLLRHIFPLLCSLGEKMDELISDSSEVVILPSRYHLDLMKKLTGKPVKIVYPGVEAAKEIPEKRGEYLLAVARWEHGKKPLFYLDLLEKLKEDDLLCDLVMVGPWKEFSLKERFLKEVEKRGLIDHVRLYGAAGRDELRMLYQGARVLVHAVSESFGMIGLEAAANGCPFIIPRSSGVTDLFTNGVHGFFCRENDLVAYSECAEKLISDGELAVKIGYEAWKTAQRYTWIKHAESIIKVINENF
jgi:glycosyltransferase involved in cell wall biosynthesis